VEERFQLLNNGQSVLQADFNTLGEVSGLADDRLLAELFRLQPYDGATVRRAILPYRHEGSGATGLVTTNGASGSVLVNPFRAMIGSRTAVATNAKKNWRDIRSAIGVGSTTLGQSVSLTANASGNPRWDLVWAAVAIDANSASVTRKVKDPTTKVITSSSVVTTLVTTVTLGSTAGTPAASPAWPAVPADSGSTYYVPLAYVRVPNGFGAGSTVAATDIATVAPVLGMPGSGGVQVADQSYVSGSATLTAAQIQTWGSTGTRPQMFMPSTMIGAASLLVPLNLTSPSHANGDTIDSRDWRNRISRFIVQVGNAGTQYFPWQNNAAVMPNAEPVDITGVTSNAVLCGVGQSFVNDSLFSKKMVAYANGSLIETMADGTYVGLYVDTADSGKLKVYITGSPACLLFFWIDFSAPFENPF